MVKGDSNRTRIAENSIGKLHLEECISSILLFDWSCIKTMSANIRVCVVSVPVICAYPLGSLLLIH